MKNTKDIKRLVSMNNIDLNKLSDLVIEKRGKLMSFLPKSFIARYTGAIDYNSGAKIFKETVHISSLRFVDPTIKELVKKFKRTSTSKQIMYFNLDLYIENSKHGYDVSLLYQRVVQR